MNDEETFLLVSSFLYSHFFSFLLVFSHFLKETFFLVMRKNGNDGNDDDEGVFGFEFGLVQFGSM